MAEPVRAILGRKASAIWGVTPEATVFEAIALMAEKGIGAVLVLAGDELVGIVSERDYARKVVLRGKNSRETAVSEIMSSPVFTIHPELRTDECMRLVTEKRIRHLPVTEQGRLVGIVTIGDLVKSIISEQAETIVQLTSYIEGRPL
ncbi:MAG: CBS domain-containing protein [Bryobacterales bacterium]